MQLNTVQLRVQSRLTGRSRGFTLIELAIVMFIVAVLAAIAYPSYRDYVIKARRSDGQSALLEIQKQLTAYYGRCGTYPLTLGAGGAAPPCTTGLGLTVPVNSPNGNYTVTYVPAPFTDPATGIVNPNSTYVLTATPTILNRQIDDTKCAALTITEAGQRGRTGAAPMNECWKN